MARKEGVGIWHHYRTNETPKADGLETSFTSNGMHYRARLYWAPADMADPTNTHKQPYVSVWLSPSGKMNSFGQYDDELHAGNYVGKERSRRNWKELLEIGRTIDSDRLVKAAERMLRYHEAMLAEGCTYQHKSYYFPPNSDPKEIMERVRKAIA